MWTSNLQLCQYNYNYVLLTQISRHSLWARHLQQVFSVRVEAAKGAY